MMIYFLMVLKVSNIAVMVLTIAAVNKVQNVILLNITFVIATICHHYCPYHHIEDNNETNSNDKDNIKR